MDSLKELHKHETANGLVEAIVNMDLHKGFFVCVCVDIWTVISWRHKHSF